MRCAALLMVVVPENKHLAMCRQKINLGTPAQGIDLPDAPLEHQHARPVLALMLRRALVCYPQNLGRCHVETRVRLGFSGVATSPKVEQIEAPQVCMRPFFSSRPPKRELLGYRRATITYSTTRTDLRSCPHNHRSIATMALLGLFKSEDEKRADELRQGTAVPKRAERQRCWDSRDKYFACLDKAGIIDALKDDKAAAKACKAESNEFEQNCAAQWVGFLLGPMCSP